MITPSSAHIPHSTKNMMLFYVSTALAFCPTSGCGSLSVTLSQVRVSAPRATANSYDIWWEERRARNAVAGQQMRAAAQQNAVVFDTGTAAGRAALRAARAEAAKAAAARAEAAGETPTTLPLDDDFWWTRPNMAGEVSEMGWMPPASSSIGLVLTDFVESTYAKAVFNNARVDGTDRATVRGMFSEVRLRDGTLELTMKPAFENIEGLLDRLSKYLRAKVPQIKEIHQMLRDGRNIL